LSIPPIDIGKLSEPATKLIEKISDAVEGIFRPYQIKRIAEAEAQADKIKAVSQVEITEIQYKAMRRFFAEEAKKQVNMDNITAKALPELNPDAKPEQMEDDWITNFFDKSRLISDDQMQTLWAKLLAGEANSPGRYSKRTVDLLASMDKSDAELFKNLCSFGWVIFGVVPIVFEPSDNIYTTRQINFDVLRHLDAIGFATFDGVGEYRKTTLPKSITVLYYGRLVELTFPQEANNDLAVGKVLLSKAGEQLAPLCGSQPCLGFMDYVINKWRSLGVTVNVVGGLPSI